MTPEQIRDGLKEMAKAHGPTVSNIAKVKSVNESAATCELEDEDGQLIFDVRLRPVLNGKKSFIQIPKVGSFVLAVRIEDDEDWMVIGCDEVTKVVWYVGTTIVEFSDKVHIESHGENMANLMDDLFVAINNMVFTTPNGPTTGLVNMAQFTALKMRFKKLLK